MYRNCSLYAIKSKKMLLEILDISNNKKWLKKKYVHEKISPFIFTNNMGKSRLIEAPTNDLKFIQKKIKKFLLKIDIPTYVYSGVRNKSYVDNAKQHKGNKYVFKVDIQAFFPSISRELVYSFFVNKLKTSPDVANCLTNFCTYDLRNETLNSLIIEKFLENKRIRSKNHLCTGSSPSPILSYLVNKDMFDEIKKLCELNEINMTIYIDDIIFSSYKEITKINRFNIINIIKKYGYNISKKKLKYYKNSDVKKVTGVIITKDGNLEVPNRLRLKIKNIFNKGEVTENLDKLYGCIIAARQIKNVYPNIKKFLVLNKVQYITKNK